MKNFPLTLSFKPIFISLIAVVCFSQSTLSYSSTEVERSINTLIEKELPHTTIGFIIQDLASGKIIFEKRAEDNFHPASNTKLFTASAALKFFGPDFQFQTTVHSDLTKLNEGILSDNVYVVFRGDPSMTVDDLTLLIKQLKAKGINEIRGNVILDDQAFEEPYYAPGWTWDSLPWYYSAPVTSIILNENKVRFKLNKPKAIYQPINIEQADNFIPTLSLKTEVIAVSSEEAKKSCQLNVTIRDNRITLKGCWSIEKLPSSLELAFDQPKLLAKQQLEQELRQQNIKLSGKITFAATPKQLPIILVKRSPPLKELLVKVLADSNNLYSESLTKALGIAYVGRGTFQAGTIAIEEILKNDTELNFNHAKLSDGSGQSRYNLVSPYLIAKLLQHMAHSEQFPAFYAALASNGKHGTLLERSNTPNLTGKINAKTGSAMGTSALSGYLTGKSGNQYIFSIMINQSNKNYYALKAFEDKLCQLMIEEPWLKLTPPAKLKH